MSNFEKIFTSIKFGTLELPNRIVMSPMVTHYATDNGTVTQRVIDYYTARAAGGVGLIKDWLSHGCEESPQHMAQLTFRLVTNTVSDFYPHS